MKQPKTIGEFLALPIRDRIYYESIEITDVNRAELEARYGGTLMGKYIRIPKVHQLRALFTESDTIFLAGEWILAEDELGLCRHKRFV